MFEDKRAINGTHGMVYINGELIMEATALKATVSMDFQDVPMCGDLSKHRKYSGRTCNGEITITKINSRFAVLLSEAIKDGKTPSFTIASYLKDPDAYGAERVVLKNCQFDTLSLADWSAGNIVTESQSFSFTDWEYTDLINP